MLLLCSNGLSSANLLSATAERLVNCSTAALVVTADNVYKENNYHVPRCISELESLNLSVDTFDLDKSPADLLLAYDVVSFIGGNPYYLLDSIRKHNAFEVLQTIVSEKLLVGWSAAAFVFSPTLELVNCFSPEMNFLGLEDLHGLALTTIEVLPHYSRFINKFDRFEETCCNYEREHNVNVIRLNDGDGVFINGDEVYICKS